MGGTVTMESTGNAMRLHGLYATGDDFATISTTNPPGTGPAYRIKYLDADSMVCVFPVQGPIGSNTLWWWHDVYKK